MLEVDIRAGSVATTDARNVHVELVNSNRGDRERAVMVNRHAAIVSCVQRFARRQHISTRAVDLQISPHPQEIALVRGDQQLIQGADRSDR
jgi:hypothetical protein